MHDILFINANVIDTRRGEVLADQQVLIRNGRIARVASTAEASEGR